MVKAQIIECYKSSHYQGKERVETMIHETRYFITKVEADDWVASLGIEKFDEDDPERIGAFVQMERLENHKKSQFMNTSTQNRLRFY